MLQTKSHHTMTYLCNSQGAWILFGKGGQEDIGKVDEKRTNGLL